MKKIYFVRHGQTVWNVENKICGATDSPLTELGIAQAKETGEAILRMNIKADMILTSPLSRAHDTAIQISNETGIPLRVERRLMEQNFGKYESTPRDGEEFRLQKENFVYDYDGGESMMRVGQRIYNLLDDLAKDDKIYILVAHNGIARVIRSYFQNMSNEEYAAYGVKNCEVVEYEFKSV
ncbi:MAG: phosphoglycerate mutase family protein [Lachnospiraceae bacterium]|nr:phosphoglycerate mutase family protein [Lachnospiraceae bacterium]